MSVSEQKMHFKSKFSDEFDPQAQSKASLLSAITAIQSWIYQKFNCQRIILVQLEIIRNQYLSFHSFAQINHIICNMKEIITINVGDAGIRIGDSALTQYIRQHSLSSTQQQKGDQRLAEGKHTFFDEMPNGTFKYRAIDIDCDPHSIDVLLKGSNNHFYSPKNLISSKEDSGGLYSRGLNIIRQLKQDIRDTLRKTFENCDHVEGILFNGSVSGGASGAFSEVAQSAAIDYCKVSKIGSIIYPSDYCNNVIQPYNFTLAAASQLNSLDLVVPFSNQTLYTSCEQYLGIQKPGFHQINRMIAQFQSKMTLSMRHGGSLNTGFSDLLTNLVCYPRIHFAYPSFVGFQGDSRNHSINNNYLLTKTLLEPASRLLDVQKIQNKIAISLFYRGNVNPFDVQQSISKMKQEKHFNCVFQEWSPLGFKLAVNDMLLNQLQYQNRTISRFSFPSCCSLTSSIQFGPYFGSQNLKFDKLYAKRAFVHWYVGDMQEGELTEGRQDLAALQKDYEPSCCPCCEESQYEGEDVQ